MKLIGFGLIALQFLVANGQYSFPENFQFGLATASYQVEGAWNLSGKGENIWDHLTHTQPELILGQANGDVACDSYHKFKEDVAILKQLGVDFYRFSLSWSRILPSGFINHINPDGIRYYNELIDELIANDITPYVTIYHWDLPQPLQEIGGWPNPMLDDIYVDFARVAFENFGDRVKYWFTFNEPIQTCEQGYSSGQMAPAYHSDGIACYLCGRTLLLAHAKAYRMYDTEFRPTQGGKISIAIDSNWHEPETEADAAAAERGLQMDFGWWAHPIYSQEGDYPSVMYERINALSAEEGFSESRLPPFTPEEVELIKGTSDFFGLNHYTTRIDVEGNDWAPRPSHAADVGSSSYQDPNWEPSEADWLKVVPWGLRKLLNWIKNEYGNPEIVITENGYADPRSAGLDDCRRINYYNSYLEQVLLAIHEDGVNVSGYTAWSLLDNFEWMRGFEHRFGLVHVDFDSPERTRSIKQSAGVYSNIVKTRNIDWDYTPAGFNKCVWN